MSLNTRIKEIVDHYSNGNVSAFGSTFNSVTAENIRKLIKNDNANPSYNFIVELLEKYPTISVDWFLFGKGEMFSNTIAAEPGAEYGNKALQDRVEKLEDFMERISLIKEINEVLSEIDQEEEQANPKQE